MKNTHPKATKTVYPIICQIVNVIPNQFVAQTAGDKSPLVTLISCADTLASHLVETRI